MRASASRPLLRVVPLAVLMTITVAALTRRLPANSSRASVDAGTSLPDEDGDAHPVRPLDAPLRGPSPPPNADVPVGTARTLHGGPRRTHRVRARGPRTPRIGFRTSVGGPVVSQVTASPDESTLYVSTLGGQLVALSRADGARSWSVALGDRAYGTPLVGDDGTIYLGTDAKKLLAVSPKGTVLFRLETEGEADTSAAFDEAGNVVFAAGNRLHSMRRGGDLAWRFAARGKIFTAPAITNEGLVIVGAQDHHVHAVGVGGELAWKVDLAADVDGAPAIGDDGSIYVGTDAGDVVRLDARGNVLWRTPVGGFVRGSLSIARNGDVIVGTYGPVPRVVRIGSGGAVRGAFAIPGTGAREFGIHGGPLEDADGVLYFGAQDDAAYAVGPDGGLRWRFEAGGDIDGPLTMLADGSLVVPSEAGTVTLLLP